VKLVRSSRWISSFELGFGGEVERVAGGEDVLMSLGKEWLMRSANNAGEAKAFPWLFGKSAYPEGGREAGCLPNGLAQDSPASVSPRDGACTTCCGTRAATFSRSSRGDDLGGEAFEVGSFREGDEDGVVGAPDVPGDEVARFPTPSSPRISDPGRDGTRGCWR